MHSLYASPRSHQRRNCFSPAIPRGIVRCHPHMVCLSISYPPILCIDCVPAGAVFAFATISVARHTACQDTSSGRAFHLSRPAHRSRTDLPSEHVVPLGRRSAGLPLRRRCGSRSTCSRQRISKWSFAYTRSIDMPPSANTPSPSQTGSLSSERTGSQSASSCAPSTTSSTVYTIRVRDVHVPVATLMADLRARRSPYSPPGGQRTPRYTLSLILRRPVSRVSLRLSLRPVGMLSCPRFPDNRTARTTAAPTRKAAASPSLLRTSCSSAQHRPRYRRRSSPYVPPATLKVPPSFHRRSCQSAPGVRALYSNPAASPSPLRTSCSSPPVLQLRSRLVICYIRHPPL
ncbi:hypothetical protein B0H14DRAFT_1386925 [Mycena olivaceomarginata]|nr:hypothetical protein B0H14DRAFT_1386925 [Mycena olivaceomarginata]